MEWEKFRNSWDNLIETGRYAAFAVIVLAFVNLILVVALLKKSEQKVVILPPKVDKEFWVAGNQLSKSYLEMVGNFIADKYLSVSPESAKYQHSLLFPFVSLDALPSFKKELLKLEKFVKDEEISQVFYPKKLEVNKNEIQVEGILNKFVGSTLIKSEKVIVKIKFTVKGGQFQILSIGVESA